MTRKKENLTLNLDFEKKIENRLALVKNNLNSKNKR